MKSAIIVRMMAFTAFAVAGMPVTWAQDQAGPDKDASGGIITQPIQVYGLGKVEAVAFSPDGHHVLLGGAANAYLYNADTYQRERVFTGHTDRITSVAFSPDGMKILTYSFDHTAKLWDTALGTVLQTFSAAESTYNVNCAVLSPDGSKVLTGNGESNGYRGMAELRDALTGAALETFPTNATVNSVAFTPDGMKVLTYSYSSVTTLWDVATGEVLQTFATLGANVVALSPDGTKLLMGSDSGTTTLWDMATATVVPTFSGPAEHYGSVSSVAFSPDGTKVLAGFGLGNGTGVAMLCDAATGAVLQTLTGYAWLVDSVAFSSDGMKALMGSEDGTAKFWDVATGAVIETISGHVEDVTSVAFSPDGTQVLAGSGDLFSFVSGPAMATLYDTATAAALYTFSAAEDMGITTSVAFSPDGTKVLTGLSQDCCFNSPGTAKLWDAATGTVVQTFTGSTEGGVLSVAFSPDGTRVLTGSQDQIAKLWDVATGAAIQAYLTGGYSVAFSLDGTKVLTADGSMAQLSDAATATVLQTFWANPLGVNSVAFDPGGTKVLTGSRVYDFDDGTAELWDVATGAVLQTYSGHTTQVYSVAFSPDGTKVLTGSDDETLGFGGVAKLFDAATGTLLRTFAGHTEEVTSVAFTSDGTKVLTGSADGTARLWDATIDPPMVSIPNVVGMTQAAAQTAITSAGLAMGAVTLEYSNTVAAENVIRQNPAAGAKGVAPGTAVALVVSKGSQPFLQCVASTSKSGASFPGNPGDLLAMGIALTGLALGGKARRLKLRRSTFMA